MPLTFATELDRALRIRRRSPWEVARETGLDATQLGKLRAGRCQPTLQTADILAEALDWDGLVSFALAARTRQCVICERDFVATDKQALARYCGDDCKAAAHRRRTALRKAAKVGRQGVLERHHLRELREAVAAFCRACEPDGLCRTPECNLRAVSPLPLVLRRSA
jgi:hypothetical protein